MPILAQSVKEKQTTSLKILYVSSEAHKKAKRFAVLSDITMQKFIENLIERFEVSQNGNHDDNDNNSK